MYEYFLKVLVYTLTMDFIFRTNTDEGLRSSINSQHISCKKVSVDISSKASLGFLQRYTTQI